LASPKHDAFTALNTAFFGGGGVLEIAGPPSAAGPIHLLLVSSGSNGLVCPRLLIHARAGSRETVLLDFVSTGDGEGLVNEVCEIFVEENATLDFILLEREGAKALHVGNLQAHQQRGSHLRIHTISLGGALVRNELGARLADEDAEIDLRGLYVGTGSRHIDNHTLVDHALPHTTSRQVYKGVLADRSRAVFRGLVHVRPNAQKIDSSQSNKNLLLSEKARVDTRPQLEIYADDVKCSHGSTVGKLDEDALFYLRSRGLSESDARGLLTRGFVEEICNALPGEALCGFVRGQVMDALSACDAGALP
jgi:Fe-S cluster assembly protein SufD